MTGASERLLLVVVGTDHHPFDRLVGWVDEWLEAQPDPPRAVVQYGTSSKPRLAQGVPTTGRSELDELMREADVVVTHGGPATITEVRRFGKLPLVVARDPRLGEHVDHHQQRFTRRMDASGFVRECATRDDLHLQLSSAVADPATVAVDPDLDQSRLAASVARAGDVIDTLIAAQQARSPGRSHRRRLLPTVLRRASPPGTQ